MANADQVEDTHAAPDPSPASQTAQKQGKQRWLRRVGVGLVTLVFGYTAIWFGFALFLQDQFDNWMTAVGARDGGITFSERHIRGFPLSWRLELTDPRLITQDGLEGRAERFTYGFEIRNPRLIEWTVEGRSEWRRAASERNGAPVPALHADVAALSGTYRLTDTGLQEPTVAMRELEVQLDPTTVVGILGRRTGAFAGALADQGRGLAIAIDAIDAGITLPVWPATEAGEPALYASFDMRGATVLETDGTQTGGARGSIIDLDGGGQESASDTTAQTNAEPPDFTQGVEQMTVEATFTGPLPASFDEFGAFQWRNQGGEVEITTFLMDLGVVEVNGTGVWRLDDRLQPEGQLDLRITEYRRLLDALIETRTLPPRQATMISFLLRAIESPDEAGRPGVTTRLVVVAQTLNIGNLRIFNMPFIEWQ